MQAIILATDEQRKLPPLTDALPGPLLPVVDRPVMATTVETLARSGVKRLLISLLNHGGSIAAYFGSGKRWGIEIEYATQREGWGSAGSLRWAARLLHETFLVIPGDSVIDLDIEAALAFHQSHGGPATAIVHAPLEDSLAPTLRRAADGRLCGPDAAADATTYSATGAFIFEPSVLGHIPGRATIDLVEQLLPALLAAGEPVYCYPMSGYWNPLDSLRGFQEAQQVFLYSAYSEAAPAKAAEGPTARVRHPALGSRQIAPGVWVGLNHSIHPTVKLAPPVFIGENSWIGREVELGAGTVIGSDAVIDDEATVIGSTVLSETYIGQLLQVEGRIVTPSSISDPASGETTRVVDPFLLSRVGAQTGAPSRLRRVFSSGGAALILVVLSPLFLVVWLLAALTTAGRPIVRSLRVGQRIVHATDGQGLYTFELLQFRTHWPTGAPTLVGPWLERWELHRLPELINVLRGNMELVGVKPLRPEEMATLNEEWHQKRHDAPAGFTGLWYQQADPTGDLDPVLVADVYYTATRTWRGDLLILLRTPSTWASRHTQRGQLVVRADNAGSM